MKAEWRIYAGLSAFVLVFAVVYVALSREPVGSLLLFACSLSLFGLGIYLWGIHRRDGDRPEDMTEPSSPGIDARADGSTEVGDFPSGSIWPLFMGLSCLGIAWGLAFTAWITLPAAAALLISVVGYAHEVETG
ncbi:MAG: cytochrome c oxidase subunit 4 [Actinomycetota bacterium]|nr:cytochrome c oxidase subunit 4 [Actinomycetota bacterium]